MEQKNNFAFILLKRSAKWTPFRKLSLNGVHFLKGFTLIEVLITVIIIGIIASLAYPRYTKTIEKSRIGEAEANLRLIRAAERMYKMQFGTYTTILGDNGLNLDLTDPAYSFTYNMVSADATTFRARAVRNGGTYNGQYIWIEEDGQWGGNYSSGMIPSD